MPGLYTQGNQVRLDVRDHHELAEPSRAPSVRDRHEWADSSVAQPLEQLAHARVRRISGRRDAQLRSREK